MSDGTSLAQFNAAIITKLTARAGYSATGIIPTEGGPTSAADLQGTDGAYEAVWIENADATLEPAFMGTPVVLDEKIDLDVIIQVLKAGVGADTQTATTARAVVLLGELVGAMCTDPTLGLASPTSGVTAFEALPRSWEQVAGWMGKGDEHGCRFLVKVHIEARLNLT